MTEENAGKPSHAEANTLRHDLSGSPRNRCFGCGDANQCGLQLHFYIDGESRVLCRFTLDDRFQGPPQHAHGGVIATVLDEAMSKANRRRGIVAMTRHMSVDYRKPVPLAAELVVEGWSESDASSDSSRKHRCSAELRDASGTVLAQATGLFIEVPPEVLKRYAPQAD